MDGLDQIMHNEIILQNEDDGRTPIWKYPNTWIAGQKELRVDLDEEALYIRDGKICRAFQQGTFDLPAELIERLSARVQEEEPFPSEGFYFIKKFCTLDFRFRAHLYARIPGCARDQRITISGEYTVGVKNPGRLTMDAFRRLADHWSEDSHRYMQSRLNDYIEWQMTGAFTGAILGNFPYHSLKDQLSARVTSMLQNVLESHGLTLLEFRIWHMDMPEECEEIYMNQKVASALPLSPPGYAEMTSETANQEREEMSQAENLPAQKARISFLGAGISVIGSVVGAGISAVGGAVGATVATAVGAAEKLQNAKNRSDSGKKNKAPLIQNIQISAVAPKKFIKGDYSMVRVLLYEEAYRHIVEAVKTTEDQEERTTAQVPENALVRVRLTSPDLEIEDDEQESLWTGSFQEFGFAVMLPINYPKRTIQFRAMISFDGVPATRLTFVAKCRSLLEQKLRVARQDILSAFVSYASADREDVVRVIQGMRKARPDMDIFIDVEKLRSGENWQNALYGEIDQRDLLVLCWSRAAKKSEWVDREWRYAMAQKGVDCIDPVPLEPSEICPPPPELDRKHFNDNLNYMKRNRNWQ